MLSGRSQKGGRLAKTGRPFSNHTSWCSVRLLCSTSSFRDALLGWVWRGDAAGPGGSGGHCHCHCRCRRAPGAAGALLLPPAGGCRDCAPRPAPAALPGIPPGSAGSQGRAGHRGGLELPNVPSPPTADEHRHDFSRMQRKHSCDVIIYSRYYRMIGSWNGVDWKGPE